jgi:hypothetical protein
MRNKSSQAYALKIPSPGFSREIISRQIRRTGQTGYFLRCSVSTSMFYHVVAFTMAQVRQGALEFQRQLGAVLRDASELKVYSASPFDLEERRRAKDRFGGDIVYFFNDVAYRESQRLGLELQFVAEISDEELPRRRTVVVGMPESKIRA